MVVKKLDEMKFLKVNLNDLSNPIKYVRDIDIFIINYYKYNK